MLEAPSTRQAADGPLFLMELFDHDAQSSVDSRACYDIDRAEITFEAFASLHRKPWPSRSTGWTSIASVADAILVNAPTLGGGNLLQGQAVAISCTTGIHALLSGLSRRKGERGEIGVARIERSRTR